jgi:hypothetical protein
MWLENIVLPGRSLVPDNEHTAMLRGRAQASCSTKKALATERNVRACASSQSLVISISAAQHDRTNG